MLGKLFKHLMNRQNIAPDLPDGLICCVPGCTHQAVEQWMPAVCALREANVKVDWVHVCAEHDVELNEMTVRKIYGPRYDRELAVYRMRMTELHPHHKRNRDGRSGLHRPDIRG